MANKEIYCFILKDGKLLKTIIANFVKKELVMKFSELVRILEKEGFRIVKEKGSVRYYGKSGFNHLIRVDYHGSKEVPTGTCFSILKSAGIK